MSGTTSPPPIAPGGMSPKQRFFFDLKGWLLVPSVLSQEDCEAYKAEIEAGGSCYEGRLQELIDHPAAVGILGDILALPPFFAGGTVVQQHDNATVGQAQYNNNGGGTAEDAAREANDYLPFRCEGMAVTRRTFGYIDQPPGSSPQQGPHVARPPQHAHPMRFQVDGGQIYSGLTRVVFELNPVKKGQGGT